MTQIDWSKKPEGYPLWLKDLNPCTGGDMSGWHRDDGDKYTDESGLHWKKCNPDDYIVYSEPQKSWAGEGLPPVGAECIVTPHNTIWGFSHVASYPCTVLAYHDDFVWVDLDGVSGTPVATRTDKVSFSPIRTPEQIAAEQRASAWIEYANKFREEVGVKSEAEARIRSEISMASFYAGYDARMDKMMSDAEEVKS